jgi:hypothetical protein
MNRNGTGRIELSPMNNTRALNLAPGEALIQTVMVMAIPNFAPKNLSIVNLPPLNSTQLLNFTLNGFMKRNSTMDAMFAEKKMKPIDSSKIKRGSESSSSMRVTAEMSKTKAAPQGSYSGEAQTITKLKINETVAGTPEFAMKLKMDFAKSNLTTGQVERPVFIREDGGYDTFGMY